MDTPVTTWGGFLRIVICALFAVAFLDVPAVTDSSLGHFALLFLVMGAFRSLLSRAERVARGVRTKRRLPEA